MHYAISRHHQPAVTLYRYRSGRDRQLERGIMLRPIIMPSRRVGSRSCIHRGGRNRFLSPLAGSIYRP